MSFAQPAPAQGYHSAQGVSEPKRPSSVIMSRKPGMVAVAWIFTPQLPATGSQVGFVFSSDHAVFSAGWQRNPVKPWQLLALVICPLATQ